MMLARPAKYGRDGASGGVEAEMEIAVGRLIDPPADDLLPLVAESEREGWRFIRRLATETETD